MTREINEFLSPYTVVSEGDVLPLADFTDGCGDVVSLPDERPCVTATSRKSAYEQYGREVERFVDTHGISYAEARERAGPAPAGYNEENTHPDMDKTQRAVNAAGAAACRQVLDESMIKRINDLPPSERAKAHSEFDAQQRARQERAQ